LYPHTGHTNALDPFVHVDEAYVDEYGTTVPKPTFASTVVTLMLADDWSPVFSMTIA
jgi:hypothetical protein